MCAFLEFLLVLIELFLLGVTAEALRANIDWKSEFRFNVQGQFDPKFQVEEIAPFKPFVFSEN